MAYLTGRRPSDALKIWKYGIINGMLPSRQEKTGTKLRISLAGELLDIINRIKDRKAKHTIRSLSLIVDEAGQRFSYFMLRSHFDKARDIPVSGFTGKIRD